MIDITTDVPADIRGIFSSAYRMCKSKIDSTDKNTESYESAISSTVNKCRYVLENDEELCSKLREYLLQEIKCLTAYDDTTGVFSKDVRNKKWWDDYRIKNPDKLKYWSRYSHYLEADKSWDPVVIENGIGISTDIVMNKLADPALNTNQDIRGLVFGHVQSGKTAHYIGLINKAIDAGYKVIVVLAGIHNNLRSQTQTRIDEEVLGFESSLEAIFKNNDSESYFVGENKIGVGKYSVDFPFQVCTSRAENGDFNSKRAESLMVNPPVLAVIKKNKSSLESLIKYWGVKSPILTKDGSGNYVIGPEYPMLLIDDEADQASLNTKYSCDSEGELKNEQNDPSRINGYIRSLLNLFSCKSYVGYTATPYANIFIPPDYTGEEFGNDLFPKDFIIKMPTSPKYFGAKEFFGWKEDRDEMPLYRPISVQQTDESVHKSDLANDLCKAIQMFFLSTAIRNCRGQRHKPNSMLIHTDREIDEHTLLYSDIVEYLDNLKMMIAYNDKEQLESLKRLWEDDYLTTTESMKKSFSNRVSNVEMLSWDSIKEELYSLSREQDPAEIKCKVIDGKSKDFLDYEYHMKRNLPYNVIIVGGDKLSRGLTLEGLTVSYFTRSSQNYDTLMQMGRWFGYRPGYLDLCRLFVTPEIYDKFRHISHSTDDLIKQIEYMNDLPDATPYTFGLRVLAHPDMEVSSRNKTKHSVLQRISFSNTATQTTRIDIDAELYNNNFAAVEKLVNTMGKPIPGDEYADSLNLRGERPQGKHLFWTGINGKVIATFFKSYSASRRNYRANSKNIAEYIEDQLNYGGLTDWTVCLINVGKVKDLKIGSLQFIGRGVERNSENGLNATSKIFSLKTLTSLNHEFLDYSQDECDLREKYKQERIENGAKRVSLEYLREKVRSRKRGLLILYPLDTNKITGLKYGLEDNTYKTPFAVAVVFPHNGGRGDEKYYRVNKIIQMNEADDAE